MRAPTRAPVPGTTLEENASNASSLPHPGLAQSCPVEAKFSETNFSDAKRNQAKLEAIGASACVGMFFLNGLILYVCIRLVLYVYAGASNAISRELLHEAGMSKGFVVMFWQLVFICCFVEGAWL